jgi:DNA-binding transcriptional LysR family regulator
MSAAAEKLNMSQAAVSQAITALEQAVGASLFDRTVRPPVLTLPGQSGLQSALEVFSKLREFEDSVRHGSSGRVPLLRIGVIDSFLCTAGPTMLNEIRDVASEWTLASHARETNFQALVDRRADVVITGDYATPPPTIDARPVLTESFLLVLPPGYRGTVKRLKSLHDEMAFLRFGRDGHAGTAIERLFDHLGTQPTSAYNFDTTDAALRMSAEGFGWTITTPLILLKSGLLPGSVRLQAIPGTRLQRTLTVAMRRGESERVILDRIHQGALRSIRRVLPLVRAAIPGSRESFSIAASAARAVSRRGIKA